MGGITELGSMESTAWVSLSLAACQLAIAETTYVRPEQSCLSSVTKRHPEQKNPFVLKRNGTMENSGNSDAPFVFLCASICCLP